MPYRICKTFTFSASHRLPDLPPEHKCARLHGHNYAVEIVVRSSDLAAPGFVADFAVLDVLKSYLDARFDHQHLNDVMPAAPTSENVAEHIARWFTEHLQPVLPTGAGLDRVRVSETGSTWGEYLPQEQR